MFVVDTNVLVYAADTQSPFHVHCLEAVERWRKQSGPWYLTVGICFEFLRVVTHPRALNAPQSAATAWRTLDALFESPGLQLLGPGERFRQAASEVISAHPALRGNVMHDVETAVLMREHGVGTIYTFDNDFRRFKFLKVVDPVVEPI